MYRSADYGTAKTLTEEQGRLFTFQGDATCSRLYEIEFPASQPNTPKKTRVGHFAVIPNVVTGVNMSLFCTEDAVYYSVNIKIGDGFRLTGRGKPSAAVYYNGLLYVINDMGDIDALNPVDGTFHSQISECALFEGSRGLAAYNGSLYAIGRNQKFYQINPNTKQVQIRGTGTFTNTGPMKGYEP